MSPQVKLNNVSAYLTHAALYAIGRMLMTREHLTRDQWNRFDRNADAICDYILSQLPVDHPDSTVWDNRRPRR